MYVPIYIYIYIYIYTYMVRAAEPYGKTSFGFLAASGKVNMVAIFCPFGLLCEIGISLLSL